MWQEGCNRMMLTESSDRISQLYPFVDESKTTLPRCWNSGDKFSYLIVSNQNLRVTYRGAGKNHKDAAAVRANNPIPVTCGIYYFEVTIVSKGRDGYMGIGLCEKEVSLNRLPGWDRNSYGYHADDGNFFSSSGNGTQYGPTFTTNDVVGCGYNLVHNTIFYTKNGQNIGIAYSDVPSTEELYPTVGLQTPGEIIDTNFGQKQFVYNIEEDIKETRLRVHKSISNYQLPPAKTDWTNKLVSSYLVHHGYCATANAFNSATNQQSVEDTSSMAHRQQIQKFVLNGQIAEAIEMVDELYPELLQENKQLLFILKCRQFIEMLSNAPHQEKDHRSTSLSHHSSPASVSPSYKHFASRSIRSQEVECTSTSSGLYSNGRTNMGTYQNGASFENGAKVNIKNGIGEEMDLDEMSNGFTTVATSATETKYYQEIVAFGKEVNALSAEILSPSRQVEIQKRRMSDAFSLLCYKKPRESQNGYLLDPSQRASVAAALNSAILESNGERGRASLEVLLAHSIKLRDQLASGRIGAAAFIDVEQMFLSD